MGACDRVYWIALEGMIKPNVDLIRMKIPSEAQQSSKPEEPVRMQVLSGNSFLQTRIMLLNLIALALIVQKECEVRIKIEQRTSDEAVHLEYIARLPLLLIVGSQDAGSNAAAVEGIYKTESVEASRRYLIERKLAG